MPGEKYFDLQGHQFSMETEEINGVKKNLLKSEDLNSENLIKYRDKFYENYVNFLDKNRYEHNFNSLVQSNQRHALIPIHMEMYFHTLRVANALLPDDKRKSTRDESVEFAYDQLYDLINHDLAEFLSKNNKVSVAQLNDFFDKKRQSYAIFTESAVASYIKVNQPDIKFPSEKELKKRLEKNTAADMHMQFENNLTGITTRIEPKSRHSAHSKKEADPAFMKITHMDSEGKVLQTQYRVPSLTIPKINGMKKSISQQLSEAFGSNTGYKISAKDGPVIYNLLTSIPIGLDANSQAKAAEEIFKGMHIYNSQDLVKGYEYHPKFYALNLPINQHTHLLSYNDPVNPFQNTVAVEAQHMADLAMFNSNGFSEFLSENAKEQLNILNNIYNKFLADPNKSDLFYESVYAIQAQKAAVAIKDDIIENVKINEKDSKKDKLSKTLLQLYATNYHGENESLMESQKELASLIQGMHLSLTQNNFKGCKSANERFSYIENLNILFLAYHSGTLDKNVASEIDQALVDYSNELSKENPSHVEAARNLAREIHKINDQHNVYGPGTLASYDDTGTPKSQTNKKATAGNLQAGGMNTNYYAADLYENIKQKSSSAMQAHGGVATRLSQICRITEEKIKSYDSKYIKADNKNQSARNLCIDVLKDYIHSWKRPFRNHTNEADMTLQRFYQMNANVDDETLLRDIQRLRKNITHSDKYNNNSSLNARLAFLEHRFSLEGPNASFSCEQ